MIHGRLGDTSHSPYVEAMVYIPRLNKRAGISFLVDTGADRTTILPTDGELALGIDYDELLGSEPVVGLGGATLSYVEEAVIAFSDADSGNVHLYSLEIMFTRHSVELLGVPSLLGRDILNRMKMVYDPSGDPPSVSFEVRSSDFEVRK